MSRYTHAPEPYRDPQRLPPGSAGHRIHTACIANNPVTRALNSPTDLDRSLRGPMAGHRPKAASDMPHAPRVDPPRSGVPRQHHRPADEARGYAGEQVAR
jgi:hypothetical protein